MESLKYFFVFFFFSLSCETKTSSVVPDRINLPKLQLVLFHHVTFVCKYLSAMHKQNDIDTYYRTRTFTCNVMWYQHSILCKPDAVHFLVIKWESFNLQVETLSREDLSSRLTLNVSAASVGPLSLSDSFITIMDVCCWHTFHMLLTHSWIISVSQCLKIIFRSMFDQTWTEAFTKTETLCLVIT